MTPLRILIADDHPLVRSGLRALFLTAEDLEVVGEAATGEEAVTLAERLQPDVIVMDLRMPGINGIEATRRIVQAHPQMRILVVTLFEDDDSVFAALRVGARGYILKDAIDTELLSVVRAVARGDEYVSPAVSGALLSDYRHNITDPIDLLSSREREVLQLIAEGKTNKEIATRLNLSVYTVDSHRGKDMDKLNLHSTGELVRFAVRHGLVD